MEPTKTTEAPTPWATSILQGATDQRARALELDRIIHTLLLLVSFLSLQLAVSDLEMTMYSSQGREQKLEEVMCVQAQSVGQPQ